MKLYDRNYVALAMIRGKRKAVAHGKTKKADRRAVKQNMWREVAAL